ncbi:MAG TPA: hypothetical protein VM661_13150 [Candidatus Sulfotelmatobacter sp.]|jgi:hypothetical protein|nr:hypothetical protein [Candidatus Sulfotelmatobacter sp.]
MRFSARSLLLCAGLLAGSTVGPWATAAEAVWQTFDSLTPGDREEAEAAVADMFGEDTALWPDWLDLQAVFIPPGKYRAVLVIRHPMRQACGPWGYVVLGYVGDDGKRPQLGARFCGNDLTLITRSFQSLPDFQIDNQGTQDADGNVTYDTVRWRWDGKQWLTVQAKH